MFLVVFLLCNLMKLHIIYIIILKGNKISFYKIEAFIIATMYVYILIYEFNYNLITTCEDQALVIT